MLKNLRLKFQNLVRLKSKRKPTEIKFGSAVMQREHAQFLCAEIDRNISRLLLPWKLFLSLVGLRLLAGILEVFPMEGFLAVFNIVKNNEQISFVSLSAIFCLSLWALLSIFTLVRLFKLRSKAHIQLEDSFTDDCVLTGDLSIQKVDDLGDSNLFMTSALIFAVVMYSAPFIILLITHALEN